MKTRIETIGDATLYMADCLEIMPTLGKVDAVVTDPPYGLDFAGACWDRSIPPWFGPACTLSSRIIFTTAPTTLWDYPRPDWVSCWYRPASSSRNAQGGFNHWTPVLSYGDTKFQTDTINLHAIANAYPRGFGHPSPKSVALMKWLVATASEPRSIILDPFMGSGTTGVACAKLGRKFIGIEIDEGYFDIACERIEQAYAQPSLFDQLPTQKAVQMKFDSTVW
mgnify:FL=1